ncbi:hypothetical protein [Sphingomonas hankyongi]|uniref:Uncharacterized protein n=1 Tax=Sphingomonas hankyongi TaxID=2908209 RepID=A0ABT0S318_9SPHN|nr:hypothetical protein [Sphingomonas hankyongi]MCL6730024.1 hypothetical protein [Sphingomonas hankyongi]
MSKAANLIAGIVFLIVAAVCLYRLLFYFPIDIGGQRVGQVATFFALVISAALCLILLRGGLAGDRR